MEKIVVVLDSYDTYGPCGYGLHKSYYKVCELFEEVYAPVECIEKLTVEEDGSLFTITGDIGDVEYEGVSLVDGAIHYIVSCKLKEKKKE